MYNVSQTNVWIILYKSCILFIENFKANFKLFLSWFCLEKKAWRKYSLPLLMRKKITIGIHICLFFDSQVKININFWITANEFWNSLKITEVCIVINKNDYCHGKLVNIWICDIFYLANANALYFYTNNSNRTYGEKVQWFFSQVRKCLKSFIYLYLP